MLQQFSRFQVCKKFGKKLSQEHLRIDTYSVITVTRQLVAYIGTATSVDDCPTYNNRAERSPFFRTRAPEHQQHSRSVGSHGPKRSDTPTHRDFFPTADHLHDLPLFRIVPSIILLFRSDLLSMFEAKNFMSTRLRVVAKSISKHYESDGVSVLDCVRECMG